MPPSESQLRAILSAPLRVQGGRLTHNRTRTVIARGSHDVLRATADALNRLYRGYVMLANDEQLQRRIDLARDTSVGLMARDFLLAEQQARKELADAKDHPLARSKERITFAPLYLPNEVDSWSTFAEPGTLTRAIDKLNTVANRDMTLEHGDVVVGERLQAFTWPYEHKATLLRMDGTSYEKTLPAETAYMRARWTPEAWPSVLAGHVRGFSIEGKALHVPSDGPVPTVAVDAVS